VPDVFADLDQVAPPADLDGATRSRPGDDLRADALGDLELAPKRRTHQHRGGT